MRCRQLYLAMCERRLPPISFFRLFLFVPLFFFSLSAQSEMIKLELSHGTYMLPVKINRLLVIPFILDTGATNVVITADVVSTLMRSGAIRQSDFIGTGMSVLDDGSTVPSLRFTLRELQVGDHII